VGRGESWGGPAGGVIPAGGGGCVLTLTLTLFAASLRMGEGRVVCERECRVVIIWLQSQEGRGM